MKINTRNLLNQKKNPIFKKIRFDLQFTLIISILLIYSIFIMWSACGQNPNIMQHKIEQIIISLVIMLIIAQLPPRIYENSAPYLYIISLILLIIVDTFGHHSKGAQRWINLGIIHFQPSEITKIITPLMIAYYINRNTFPPTIKHTAISLLLIFIPTVLVAIQPDLGTAILIATSGILILFLSGVSWKIMGASMLLLISFIPILWHFFLHQYQRNRILTLLNPKHDPLGASYHIIQSKIAIGSGGIWGKGWLHGTQSQLEFLPEHHTDFIFAVIGEELGFIGSLTLLLLYFLLIIRGLKIASQAERNFDRVVAAGLTLILFIYVFINISMVSGILPVVGIPLPLISYGGSALTVIMAKFGIIMSIHTHKNIKNSIKLRFKNI